MSAWSRSDTGASNEEARRLIWGAISRYASGDAAARRQATIDITCVLDVIAPTGRPKKGSLDTYLTALPAVPCATTERVELERVRQEIADAGDDDRGEEDGAC